MIFGAKEAYENAYKCVCMYIHIHRLEHSIFTNVEFSFTLFGPLKSFALYDLNIHEYEYIYILYKQINIHILG